MPRNNKKRSSRRRRGGRLSYIETFTFSVTAGAVSTVTKATLSSLPLRCNFRPLWFETEVIAFVPGSTSLPGFVAPVGCQLSLLEGQDSSVVTTVSVSPCKVVGAVPCRVRVRYPRSADWRSYTSAPTAQIASIASVCVGPSGTGTSTVLRGVGRIYFLLQNEDIVPSCPSLHLEDDSDQEGYVTCA